MSVSLHYWPPGLRHATVTHHADTAAAVAACPRLAGGTCAIVSGRDEPFVIRPNEWYMGGDRLFATDAAAPETHPGARKASLGAGPARWVLIPKATEVPGPAEALPPAPAEPDALPVSVTPAGPSPKVAPRRKASPKAEAAGIPAPDGAPLPAYVLDHPLSAIRLPKDLREQVARLSLLTVRDALAITEEAFAKRATKEGAKLWKTLRTRLAQDVARIRARHEASVAEADRALAAEVARIGALSRAERLSECAARPLLESVRIGLGFHQGDAGAHLLSLLGIDGKVRTLPVLAGELGISVSDVQALLRDVAHAGERTVGWPGVLVSRLREECDRSGDGAKAVLPSFASRGWYHGMTWKGLSVLVGLAVDCIPDTGLAVSGDGLLIERVASPVPAPQPVASPASAPVAPAMDELPFDSLVSHVAREASIDEGLPMARFFERDPEPIPPAVGEPAAAEELPAEIRAPEHSEAAIQARGLPPRPYPPVSGVLTFPKSADQTSKEHPFESRGSANAAVVFMRWPARVTDEMASRSLGAAREAMTGNGTLFVLLDDESAGLFGRTGIGDHLRDAGMHIENDINWMLTHPPGCRHLTQPPEKFKPAPVLPVRTRLNSTGGRLLHVARNDALPVDLRDPDSTESGLDGANSNGMSRSWFVRKDANPIPEVLYAMCLYMVRAKEGTVVLDAVGDPAIERAARKMGSTCRALCAPAETQEAVGRG